MDGDDTRNSVVENRIGYVFTDKSLLTEALTHSSYASENDVVSYERLEFLGDAVLEMAVTADIFSALGDASEGRMTRVRAAIVDAETLASVSRIVGLPEAMRLGVGEERNGGRDRSSIQADVVESVLGAVFVDGGADAAFSVVLVIMGDAIAMSVESLDVVDSRSALQERLGKSGSTVAFTYERTGPDHDPRFTATAFIDESEAGSGSGTSKKTAAIDAARRILRTLGE